MRRDLADPANCICLNLRRAARKLSRSYDAALAPCGLTTGQFAALLTLKQMGPTPISELASAMDVERSALTRNMAVMERSGLVKRMDGEDRRQRIIALSARGEMKLKESRPYWQNAQSEMIAKLGEDASQRLLLELSAFR